MTWPGAILLAAVSVAVAVMVSVGMTAGIIAEARETGERQRRAIQDEALEACRSILDEGTRSRCIVGVAHWSWSRPSGVAR